MRLSAGPVPLIDVLKGMFRAIVLAVVGKPMSWNLYLARDVVE